MLFNFKSIFLLVLAANAYASPISTAGDTALETRILEARAQYKDVDCNGKVFKADTLRSSISKAREVQGLKDQKKPGYSYPKPYGNDGGKMFPGASGLYEYPLNSPVYSGKGIPGSYRVIMTSNYGYKGALLHKGGNTFQKCINVEDKKKQEEEDAKKKKEESDRQSKEAKEANERKKHGKGGKR
ncbi:uncharacterized protein EURHEDRAFT_409622 [Aspergillus ruber CBS 135680]|uniref:Uncharacterized protein n=1 Tax=Aspergillus ruber (strain CBS 135680) TaxID=1388766 RepID=A0A017SPU0_ASPRC|nr:uncharacterized protein EURHEDRAFT_409622 [Aspergillus ruber CBS 135680]EYE98285.1 hypothetical protein EURHEDRAFT_409622 [Aspergillus ruber CBS 135680]